MRDLPQRQEGAEVARRLAWLAWLIGGGALFGWLFSYDATDDYAGWVLAVMVAQVPAALALERAAPGRPCGLGAAIALALPAALAFGMGVLLPSARIAQGVITGSDWLLVYLVVISWTVACACLALVVFTLGLLRRPHPLGARRVLAAVAAAGVAALAAAPPLARRDVGIWIVGAVALGWVLPLASLARSRGARPGSAGSASPPP